MVVVANRAGRAGVSLVLRFREREGSESLISEGAEE